MTPCRIVGILLSTVAPAIGATDDWYTISLADTPSGWAHAVETIDGAVRMIANTESMKIGRLNTEVTVTSSTTWIDRVDGTPVSMEWVQEMGDQPVRTRWDFDDGAMHITMEQGGRVTKTTKPAPSTPWLTPGAVRDTLAKRAAAGETELSWHIMVPDLGATPVLQTLRWTGADTLTIEGVAIEVTRWDVTIEGLPVLMSTTFSRDWRPVSTTMRAPFGTIESVLSTRAKATGERTGPPPELFANLFIRPISGTIEGQGQASRAFLRLRTLDGTPLDLPASGAQTIAGKQGNTLLLQIDRSGSLAPRQLSAAREPCRRSSTMIDSSDAAIQKLATDAIATLPPDQPVAVRAEALREAVYLWIARKGLATAFASASETVRSREGDCSEHGVLLAALLRAEGIPARVASGLVWMDGVNAFGWHMWTQAFIDGQWIDLDATLPVPFTVGHILVATSALEDGDGQRELLALLGLLGNLEIEVVRVDL